MLRPPPETSEYHAPNDVYAQTVQRLAGDGEAQAVLIPRTARAGRGGAGAAARRT